MRQLIIFGVFSLFSFNGVAANDFHFGLNSSPLYSQVIRFPSPDDSQNWYFYFSEATINCPTCQNIIKQQDSLTINYPVPHSSLTGTLRMNFQLKNTVKDIGRQIVCEYVSELPFTIMPSGDFVIGSSSYPSYLTGSYSDYWCHKIHIPQVHVTNSEDELLLSLEEVSKD